MLGWRKAYPKSLYIGRVINIFGLPMVFWKYQLQYANFRSGTSLDHAHFYFIIIKYSRY